MRTRWFIAFCLCVLALPAVAAAANPDFAGEPYENPRADTPDDEDFDPCEVDDEQRPAGDPLPCQSYTQEEFRAFGFSPDSANELPPADPHYLSGTKYFQTAPGECPQLDPQGRQANVQAENAGNPAGDLAARCLQIAGVRADSAWKFSTGSRQTAIAILDTGIRWQSGDLVDKIDLNEDELPAPTSPAPEFDPAAYRVSDFAGQVPAVPVNAGDTESDGILDASDLIATFSDGADDDPNGGNGYIDDIAGWDFFDDDNDPYDASSCCSAGGHGTGRAAEAAAQTNNTGGGVGMCPDCQVMPLRVWDTFVVPTDNYAMGVVYAARNGADVVEGAVGGLTNTQFARRAFTYADQQGLALMLVSSDINSANHNYPTNYNESIYVGGSLYDTAPNETCSGPGGLPGVGDIPIPDEFRDAFSRGCRQFLDFLEAGTGCDTVPKPPTCVDETEFVGQPLTTSFFRNSNLTQYGGKADIVLMGSTGSENTGQSSGIAGLLSSYGEQTDGAHGLTGNEVRQLLTMTAEDVMPQNTGRIGLPDKANVGWDTHFGYGRVNAAVAMARISNERGPFPAYDSGQPFAWPCHDADDTCIPPQAQIDAPDWFAPINVARVPEQGVPIRGRALARDGVGAWEVEYACGQDAADADFQPFDPPIAGTGPRGPNSLLGRIPKALLQELATVGPAPGCNGEVLADAGRPAGGSADAWPADPYEDSSSAGGQDTDPERHAFQIRLTVHEADNPRNIGRYRKTLHAYFNDGNLPGWPRPVGTGSDAADYRTATGGEASPRLYDVDGDNALDSIIATSSGELHVLNANGTPVQAFNGGNPVLTDRYELIKSHPEALPPDLANATPRESLRVPAIGDVDGDLEPEIVATAGEHLYAWELDGTLAFKTGVLQPLSEPCLPGTEDPTTGVCFDAADRAITEQNHIKRGFIGSPALAQLDPERPGLEIVAGALDQRLYAWDGDGDLLPGFPVWLRQPAANGNPIPCGAEVSGDPYACAEIITSPAIAELDGEAPPEIVLATNEVRPGDPQLPSETSDFFRFLSIALESATGANQVYAVKANGSLVNGWPVPVGVAAGDLLPLVLPGHDAAVIDEDGDGTDEVSITAGTSVMPTGARLVDGNGQTIRGYDSSGGNRFDQGPVLNLADYQSIGDIEGLGFPAVVKGGLTANGAANLLAVNQNLPFNHLEQAFDVTRTGQSGFAEPLPGFPRATDDFQLVSQASIARVGGTAPGAQALVGTGLYQVHAYGPGGVEPAGWPKFTGGWNQVTPAVGDADGDGDLDVLSLTREGWSFLWNTGVGACSDSNDEWWTYHHDERSSANYGTDGRPPGTPRAMSARRSGGSVTLGLTAPGDDWLCGKTDHLRVLVSPTPIEHPSDGEVLRGLDAKAAAGERETITLGNVPAAARHVAVLYRDESGNWGHLKSVRLPSQGGPGGLLPGRCANLKRGTRLRELLRGTALGDRLLGLAGNDRILGLKGRDCLLGGKGRDVLRGDLRQDRLEGQAGADRMKGGRGNDLLLGGRGRDRLVGGAGADRLFAGAGNDRVAARGDVRDRVDCGAGRRDVAIVDRKDRVRRCETVRRRRP